MKETEEKEAAETAVQQTAAEEKPAEDKKFNGKKWGIFGAIAVIVIALLIGIGTSYSPSGRLRKQLDLGQKYLEEMKYEEAVVAFNNAIEIDPMSVDAYLGLVEVYIRTGDFETALSYAQKGYDLTGDERLKEKIDMIESGNITASNGWVMKTSFYDYEYDTGLIGYATYIRNLQGYIDSTAIYDKDGNLIDEGEWQYDEKGNAIVVYSEGVEKTFHSGELIDIYMSLSRHEYEYDTEGRMIRCKDYDRSGDLACYMELEYDEKGREIRHKDYDRSGDLTGYQELEYDAEGREIRWKNYDESNNLLEHEEYEYDSKGRKVRAKSYDRSGKLIEYTEYEYDAEGRSTGRKKYDASGNLISEVRHE